LTALCAAITAALVALPGALAATPQEIYKDYADNGRLDKTYPRADLEKALQNALLQEYQGTETGGIESEIRQKISGVAGARQTGKLPFTGVDLALMAFGGTSLLLLGAGLRRFARTKA
jgi:hypothetical protein